TVIPIDIACRLEVSTNNGANFFTPSGCAVQFIPGTYIVRAIVTNTGSFGLANVTLTGLVGACPPVVQNLGTLDVGQSRTISLCTTTRTPVSSNYFRVSVRGEANRAGTNLCFYNSFGQVITASSTCDACVLCKGTVGIVVYKQVVCYTNGCEPFGN